VAREIWIQDFRDSADVGSDDGYAGRHGFDEYAAKRFGPAGGEDEHVS
jgi:hypothetical protein